MLNVFENSFLIKRLINRLVLRKSRKSDYYLNHLIKNQYSSQRQEADENKTNNYDIVINGGGIVGFSTLLALKRSPFLKDKKICLIERQTKQSDNENNLNENQFSNRVSSLTTSSQEFFDRIGVWNQLKDNAKPIKEFYVWSQRYKNAINFKLNQEVYGDNEIVCYVIENNRILSSLQSEVSQFEDSVSYGTVVTDIKSNSNNSSLEIQTKSSESDDPKTLRTRLLIGCDGFQSIVRQKSNLKIFEHDMEQMAIVGTVGVDCGEGNEYNEIAFQRFVPFDGSVIALLPLNEEFCSFVWSLPKDLAKNLMKMTDIEFADHLNDCLYSESMPSDSIPEKIDELISRYVPKQLFESTALRYAVPHVLSLMNDSRAVFPLKFSTTLPYLVGAPQDSNNNNRLVIIGDAAHRVHPLAGQGLNLGIGDANTLADSLHEQLSRGEALFGETKNHFKQLESCLFDFERKRQLKAIPMISAIHSMQQLFSYVPPQLLSAFNSSQLLKQRIISFANSN